MERYNITAKVSSIQTLGTVDGPGVRFVIFMHGCNLRCGYCHNPETWHTNNYTIYTVIDLFNKIKRYKNYFGASGGVTVSGGEPLLQAKFIYELFTLCHKDGINTCLDTSGSILNTDVVKVLSVTDRVLLDYKYVINDLYQKYVGCNIDTVQTFLNILDTTNLSINTTLRYVVVPELNSGQNHIAELMTIVNKHACIDCVEFLPFKKMCKEKYDRLNLPFKFDIFEEAQPRLIKSIVDYARSKNSEVNILS